MAIIVSVGDNESVNRAYGGEQGVGVGRIGLDEHGDDEIEVVRIEVGIPGPGGDVGRFEGTGPLCRGGCG